ncbi:MAG TPA: glutamine amidotransferase [Feifaniaceae bacterium]|nr:glutamine amidotransferase [Feifaniaceae bacterium]
MTKVLFAGESATIATTHIKGMDAFTHYRYNEAADYLLPKLRENGIEVEYLPCHDVMAKFPLTPEELSIYDCVAISDLGSNSLLFHPEVLLKSGRKPNRLSSIKEYVRRGGGFLMIGGYMSYAGVENKARFHETPIEDLMPVEILPYDDRVELVEGFKPEVMLPGHPMLAGLTDIPHMLFYNRTIVKAGADLVLANRERGRIDPILAVWDFGEGRAAAFTPDCAPHGAPPEFYNWPHYGRFFANLLRYLAKEETV